MTTFSYEAVESTGKSIKGMIEAADKKAAISQLAQKGQFATTIQESRGGSVKAVLQSAAAEGRPLRVSSKDLLAIWTQLTTALKAGLSTMDALYIIRDQQTKPALITLLDELGKQVSTGKSLSEAMAGFGRIFGPLHVSMVAVGETGGILEQTMEQLLKMISREEKIKSNIKNAAAYPIFVLSVGAVSVVIMLVWILPKIIKTIGAEVSTLPIPTRLLMGFGDFIVSYGWLAAIGIGIGAYSFRKWKQTPAGRLGWDAFVLKLPLIGYVQRTLAVGRFARTLGSLTKSGITILESLAVVRDTLGNEVLGQAIDRVAADVRGGRSVAEPLGQSGLFDKLLIQIVALGEQTGRLDELLLQAADTFDEQADVVLARFAALLPAILILILAVVVFFIIAATLLPILAMDMGGMG